MKEKLVVAFIEKNELAKSIIPLRWNPKRVEVWCRYPLGRVKLSDLRLTAEPKAKPERMTG